MNAAVRGPNAAGAPKKSQKLLQSRGQPRARFTRSEACARPLVTHSCGACRQNPRLKHLANLMLSRDAAAVPQRRLALISLVHRCAARSTNRSQERPPQLHSRGNPSAARTPSPRPPRAHHSLELARALCGCKAAQLLRFTKPQRARRVTQKRQDAQGPVQKTTKARPAPSVGPTGSGL